MRFGIRARLRLLVGAVLAALVAAGLVLGFSATAGAANTVNAQLSLSGVATSTSVAGGSEIGVHPGDTVTFKASALPTAGLQNVPSLGPVLQSVLDGVLGQYQVVVSFGASFPGGAKTVTLGGPTSGPCAGQPAQSFTFPNKGTYAFTWKVQYVLPLLLGCTKNGLSDSDLNLLAKAGVALNANNQWVGKVVVADNPPKGGISIQLPGVSVAPNIAGHQLPTIGVPGVQLPTVAVPVPNLNQGGTKAAGSNSSSANTPVARELPVPALVVPRGDNADVFGGTGSGNFPDVLGGVSSLDNGSSSQPAGHATQSATSAKTQPTQNSTGKHKTIDLASNKGSTGQLSVILAVLSVVVLGLVAGTYARLYLLRKP
jgi:hypothetical protein